MTEAPITDEIARALHDDGWSPLPLPAQRKGPPPEGFTGYRGRRPTEAELDAWDWSGNLAIRLPPDVVGIDVDAYNGGSLEPLERAYGELPPTTWSTSRDDGSGIALFRVPVGTTLATNPAPGVDMIQTHHRYMVVHPSVHPEGRPYQWLDEQSAEPLDTPPPPDELPALPWAWIEALSVAKTDAARAATPDEVQAFVDAHTERRLPKSLKGPIGSLDGTPGGRHDSLVSASCWAMREASAGWYPADEAIAELWAWWQRVMASEPTRRDSGEFGACIMWAVAQAEHDVERVAELRAETAKPTAAAGPCCPQCGSIKVKQT